MGPGVPVFARVLANRTPTRAKCDGQLAMTQFEDDSQSLRAFSPVLVLLAVCILINYVDRGNLSIAAPLLKDELGISASQLGILLAAFFWTYTAMQFVSGWLVDRFDVNWVIAAGYLLWSLATATTGIVRGFTILLAMRLMLGIGESVAFPSCSKILARDLPEYHRGFANGVIQSALRCGNVVGTFGAGLLMATYGWRPVFIGVGLVSLLWLPAWIRWMPRGRAMGSSIVKTAGFVDILRQRSFWGACLGHFCVNYLLYFMVTWLPFYLVRERHLSMQSMARTASVYYLVDAVSAITSGRLSDFWIRKGYTPTLVRKTVMAIGFATAAIAMAACAAAPSVYLPWIIAVGVGCGISGSGIFAFSQTLAGPEAAGRWTGLQNGFANLAGVIAPALTGFGVDRTGSFVAPMAITAGVLVAGGLAWVFVVGRVEQVNWAAKGDVLMAATTGPP
jgi:ACS family D-galactonate transporter-like MFS transporter